jgi:hypothetical protein
LAGVERERLNWVGGQRFSIAIGVEITS